MVNLLGLMTTPDDRRGRGYCPRGPDQRVPGATAMRYMRQPQRAGINSIVGKIIFWILLGLAVLALFRHFGAAARRRRNAAGSPRAAQAEEPGRAPAHDVMLACHVCRLHLPASEALFAQGRVYCCQAHMEGDRSARAGRDLN